jgi:hypothetical protein
VECVHNLSLNFSHPSVSSGVSGDNIWVLGSFAYCLSYRVCCQTTNIWRRREYQDYNPDVWPKPCPKRILISIRREYGERPPDNCMLIHFPKGNDMIRIATTTWANFPHSQFLTYIIARTFSSIIQRITPIICCYKSRKIWTLVLSRGFKSTEYWGSSTRSPQ